MKDDPGGGKVVETGMKQKTRVVLIAVAAVVLGFVGYRILATNGDPDRSGVTTILVSVAPPHRETVTQTLRFTGDVAAFQEANIFAKVSGNLEKVMVDIGARVGRNAELALIDTTVLYQQYLLTRATYENAKVSYERTRDLADRNLVSRQDIDNADASMTVAKANFETAATQLSYAHVRSPFAGYITKRFLDPGTYVNPGNSTLFTLMDIDAIKVMVHVLEKDIPLMKTGMRAMISVDAYPGREFEGKVARYSQAVDLSTRTMVVQVNVPNADHLLKPGMFANVSVEIMKHDDALTVPSETILKDDAGSFVYVANGNRAKMVRVTTGMTGDGRTEILSGLTESDTVIVAGQQFASDGAPLTIQ